MMTTTQSNIKTQVLQLAALQNKEFSQYNGYWSGSEWKLVQCLVDVRTKMGMAFNKGQYTIARVSVDHSGSFEAYSTLNKCNTVVKTDKFTQIEE